MLEQGSQEKTHNQLRQMRKERGWTQLEVADAIGVMKLAVGRWERGERMPQRFYREKLCELFGKNAVELGLLPDPTIKNPEQDTSTPAMPALWNVPYPRNPLFTGREDILYTLYTLFNDEQIMPSSRSCTLSGLSGSGKTQVAIEYAYRYAQDYAAVFWINAETDESIATSIIAIANLLNLPDEQGQEARKAALMRWLTNQSNWLVIFDHVEDPALVKGMVPSTHRGSLLFTSCRQAPGFATQTIDLERMTNEDGMHFLLRRARLLSTMGSVDDFPSTNKVIAQEIVTAMDGLPLALEQAGAYIEATQCSLADYRRLFHYSPLRLLAERDEHADYPLSVSRTFLQAFEQIEQSNPLARELLTVCAIVAPEAIPEMIFLEGARQLGSSFEALLSDPFAFNAAIKIVLNYSLVQRDARTHTLSIHRLVQIVLKGRMSEGDQRRWTTRVIAAISRLFPVDKDQSNYQQMCEQLLPHALVCIASGEQWNEDEVARIRLVKHVAAYLMYSGRSSEAKELLSLCKLEDNEQFRLLQ